MRIIKSTGCILAAALLLNSVVLAAYSNALARFKVMPLANHIYQLKI